MWIAALPHAAPKRVPLALSKFEQDVGDGARFLRSWLSRPLTMGAVSPSGKMLARMLASFVDPAIPGPVIELGPGTGPVTEALLQRGITEERLVLLEYSPEFCALLRSRFPRATIIQGDAYAIADALHGALSAPAAAIVSSLPLLTKPEEQRGLLLEQALGMAQKGAPFIQFTYGNSSPISVDTAKIRVEASPRVWLNIPPAQVWVYRGQAA